MARRRRRPQADSSSTAYTQLPLEIQLEETNGVNLVPVSVTWTRRVNDKVKEGAELAKVLLKDGTGSEVEKVLQAPRNGTLLEAAEALEATGSVVKLGMLSYCTHPYLTGLICAVCGEKGVQPEQMKRIFVKGGHELSVSKDEASVLHRSMSDKLWEARKLNLILDIDLTLLHATIDARAQEMASEEGYVHSFDVQSQGRALRHWCHLRPGLRKFLEEAHQLCVLTIYTHGRRDYAQQVAQVLDPDRSLFNDRIVSRDDCPDLQGHKSLERLFPGGIEMALIMDDLPGVWQGEQQRHLLPVVPFHFYTDFSELHRVAGLQHNFRVVAGVHDDEQLDHTMRILKDVHELYYHGEPAKLPAGHRPKNVAICLAVYRSQILKGLSIAFSGLLSRQMDPRTSDLGYMAQALGAEVTDVLTERTTHVVAERTNTEKVVEGAKRPHVHIVTRLWLHLSFLHCERKDEKAYALPGVARGGDLGDKDKNGEAREAKKEATTSKAEGDNETKGNGGGNGEGAREEEGAKEDGKKRKRERDDARGAGAKAGNGAHKDAEEDEGTTGDQDADASHVKGGDGREGESGDESLVDFAIEDGDEVHDDEGEEA